MGPIGIWCDTIAALILSIAIEVGVPPNFVLAIATVENWTLNPNAINNKNTNGTIDYGVMQINSVHNLKNWRDPETNIRFGAAYIRHLAERMPYGSTWGEVAIAYNAGMGRLYTPPASTVKYSSNVMLRYTELNGGYACPLVKRQWVDTERRIVYR